MVGASELEKAVDPLVCETSAVVSLVCDNVVKDVVSEDCSKLVVNEPTVVETSESTGIVLCEEKVV